MSFVRQPASGLSCCSSAPPRLSPALLSRPDAGNVIDANAKLHITVANEAQLTGDYTVDADGNITMLYINQVHVQGLTPAQAAGLDSWRAGHRRQKSHRPDPVLCQPPGRCHHRGSAASAWT